MNKPARHARRIRDAYQTYLQGRGGYPARSVADRLQPDSVGEDTLAGMRGPYLQALPIANWSKQSWSDFAKEERLHPNIKRAFHQEGFRRLYDFQERSVRRILEGNNTVISAATGRGKTEAWLIPILDQIVREKSSTDNKGRTSTKALLMYPTKALAQDQFKRLIQILYRINRNLRRKEWVTIGIYDGDTPRHKFEDMAQGYLNKMFQHFGCPGANDDLNKCQSCNQGVFVERTTDGFRLRPDKTFCEDDQPNDVPLDFVRLTRSEITESGADIILTNPDTINYRLFNINAETEQNAFIYDPQFLVFDEVHTYDGLLGSYTATLVKRLRRLRDRRDCDPLQVVGSSATVDNDKELFRQISGADDIVSVSEDPQTLKGGIPDSIPDSLVESTTSDTSITRSARGDGPSVPQLGDFESTTDEDSHLDNERFQDQLSEELFDYLSQDAPSDTAAQVYQALYTKLAGKPRIPEEFITDCSEWLGLSESEAETLIDNFSTVGQFAGLLESRYHLFSWPLDGFYGCSNCDAVYRSPQDVCDVCDSHFVTRATYCRTCGDEYLIANACSKCDRLVPYTHTEEGSTEGNEFRPCPHCGDGEAPKMHRVIFQPYRECIDCGSTQPRSVTTTCGHCDTEAPAVPTGDGSFTCRNPECEATVERSDNCKECNGEEFRTATITGSVVCDDCGSSHTSESLPTKCSCGRDVRSHRLVPWTCDNESCGRVYFTDNPPNSCECEAGTDFVKAGLYEISTTLKCEECGDEHLPGGDCTCNSPKYTVRTRPYRRYQTWDENRDIHSALKSKEVIPCDHSIHSTVVGDAYDELMRSPTNVAVTTSQYLLREMLNEGGFTDAKLLAFSDSHRDMKDLDRAFTDPEVGTVLDQAALLGIELCLNDDANMEVSVEELGDLQPGSIVAESEREEAGWVTLEKAIDSAYELLLLLEDELGGDDVRESMGISLAETVAGTSYIRNHEDLLKSRLHRRLVRHVGERPYQGSVSLETDGLVDVRLTPETQVTSAENTVLRELVQEGNGAQIDDLDGATRDIVDTLVMNGVLDYQGDDRVSLNQTAVEVTLPSFGDIRYDPESDNYHSNLRSQFEEEQITITCGDSLTEKAEVSSPRFSERAFTVTRSRIGILLSRVYFGGTPKMERRETEHLFREGSYPNFLSSGPTMEMGVDIGSLDTLLLYGTPPNMNAYLQRIGRAGRSSGSSLVHSVSQRNPIDYYYYEEPTELITAEKQPVPLNEHNERVLRISLAWSVLDYVASEFTIPWESSRSKISGGENISRRTETSEEVREEAAKFTKLLASTVGALKLGSEESRLRSLGWIIEDNASEIKDHLNGILDYAYCSRCHRRYEQSSAGQTCHDVDCSGMLTSALEEHGELIDDAVQTASDIFVNGYRNYADRLRERIDQYESRKKECLSEQQTATGEQASRFKNEIQQISNRIEVIEQRLQDLSDESFHTVLDDAFSEYAFNLRTASDSVGIEVVDESGEPEHIGDDQSGRAARLAIAEFHPQASYLHRRRSYAVEQVFVDEKGSTDLRETVENHTHEDDELSYLSSEFVCSNCRSTTQDPETRCECATTDWKERKLFSIESVEATLESEQLPNKVDTAQAMYQRSESVQGTYANRETEILDFTPNRRFVMKTEEGMRIGSLAFGNYEILEYTQAYRAKYKSGAVDDEWNDFELCTEPDCTGVIYSDDSDTRRCSVNSDHVVDSGNAESVAARLGYAFSTEGIRVQFEDDTSGTAHALAHGVRLALQKLAGVTIRDVNEYIGSGHADVYDSLEGGAAVSRLLVEKNDGEYQNFHSAISMIQKQFDCDCSDGCPRCLFQYGCVRRNRPRTLNKDRLIEYLKNGVVLEERR